MTTLENGKSGNWGTYEECEGSRLELRIHLLCLIAAMEKEEFLDQTLAMEHVEVFQTIMIVR